MNQEHQEQGGDFEIASRIHSYELAYKLQMSAPELLDFKQESQKTLESYGIDRSETRPHGTNCLLARRLVERGVRFVMLMHASWDHHSNLDSGLRNMTAATDRPVAALLQDLKQRGLLDETLVVWGGEFGRTPLSELRRLDDPTNIGRDHHPDGYSMWMAGGGIKPGQVIGRTDELGLKVVEDRVHVHDLQATILHSLGLDHTRLTYRHQGSRFPADGYRGRGREEDAGVGWGTEHDTTPDLRRTRRGSYGSRGRVRTYPGLSPEDWLRELASPKRERRYRLADLIAQCDSTAALSDEDREWLDFPNVAPDSRDLVRR